MKDIYLMDMSLCRPASALSKESRRGCWTMVDYETEFGRGVMLFAGRGTKSPPVTLPLNVSGWHAIYLGMYYGGGEGCLKVKLSGDPCFSRIAHELFRPEKDGHYPEKAVGPAELAEVFWKCADLTGQSITFAHHEHGLMAELDANIAYVKLVPLKPEQVSRIEADRARTDTKRLISIFDSGQFHRWGYRTEEEVREEVESHRDGDFEVILWSVALGDICYYPTKVGKMRDTPPLFNRPHFSIEAESLSALSERGIDPLKVAIDCAHELGVKLYPQIRMEGPQLPPYHELDHFGGPFMKAHPEFLCRDRDGGPIRHLSLAFPQVREHYIALFREWVEDYDADGISIIFCRSWPFVYYEEPVVRSFMERYGEDPRDLEEDDPRWLRHRAEYITLFLREVRHTLDEVGRRKGRRLGTAYLVPKNATPDFRGEGPFDECWFHGLDVETWAREGLVDYLILHIEVFGNYDGSEQADVIRAFSELVKDTPCKLYVDVYPRRMPAEAYRIKAINYYRAGAEGLAFWDSQGRNSRASEWAMVKKLGHKEELERWEDEVYFRRVPLLSLDGWPMGRRFSLPTDG